MLFAYKARDARLDRVVAVKVLPAHFSGRPDVRERFDREARTIAALNHPHICVVHDIGHQDGIDFLVMEYLEGETLAHRLAKGPLPLEQAFEYAIQMSDALDKAHREGVTHRDLKPGNIMLTKNGSKLMDFGLAKPTQDAAPVTQGSENATKTGGFSEQERRVYLSRQPAACFAVSRRHRRWQNAFLQFRYRPSLPNRPTFVGTWL